MVSLATQPPRTPQIHVVLWGASKRHARRDLFGAMESPSFPPRPSWTGGWRSVGLERRASSTWLAVRFAVTRRIKDQHKVCHTLLQYLEGQSIRITILNIFQYLQGWLGANPPIDSNTCREAAPGDQHTRCGGPRDHVSRTKSWIRMDQITPKPLKTLTFSHGLL